MHKILLYAKVTARRFSNPVFFGLLGLSFLLWYITKLSYTYTTDITIPVRIDSTQYTVRCNVEGIGYQILMHQWTPRKNTDPFGRQHRGQSFGGRPRLLRHFHFRAAKHHLG